MKKKSYVLIACLAFAIMGCREEKKKDASESAEVKTPVTIAAVSKAPVSENIWLNATSAYLKKHVVKSNAMGYVEKVFIMPGDRVDAGKALFMVKTKEAKALEKMIKGDSLFFFKGEITITAPASGIITEINRQNNDYISDGDQLAVIADQSSFVFLLSLPFELTNYAAMGSTCNILISDSTVLKGNITSKLSSVDAASQTQSYIIRPVSTVFLPESLAVVVQLLKSTKLNAQVIEKSAVLSDETMERFWVMKLINDTTAVKVLVSKGIEEEGKIEIVSPVFNADDRILISGNYGLPDTAYVTIIHQ